MISAIECNLDTPHLLDFISYYYRMIKFRMQSEGVVSDSILKYLIDSETLAYDFCKALICDEYFLKEKFSLLSASAIFMALMLVDKVKNRNNRYDKREV